MPKKILIVEDESYLVELLTVRLVKEGFEVISASNGEEAIEKVGETTPNLVIMDIMMPKMNGYQATRKIKENPATKHIPVIMLSAKGLESDRTWGLSSGADDYVTKPYEFSTLLEKMNKLLNKSE